MSAIKTYVCSGCGRQCGSATWPSNSCCRDGRWMVEDEKGNVAALVRESLKPHREGCSCMSCHMKRVAGEMVFRGELKVPGGTVRPGSFVTSDQEISAEKLLAAKATPAAAVRAWRCEKCRAAWIATGGLDSANGKVWCGNCWEYMAIVDPATLDLVPRAEVERMRKLDFEAEARLRGFAPEELIRERSVQCTHRLQDYVHKDELAQAVRRADDLKERLNEEMRRAASMGDDAGKMTAERDELLKKLGGLTMIREALERKERRR